MNEKRVCHYSQYCQGPCERSVNVLHVPDDPNVKWFCEREQRECHYGVPTVTIQLTPEQIEQLRPMAEELHNRWRETGEGRMFLGQVLTRDNTVEFHQVEFGLIPPGQSREIEYIRRLNE